MKIAVVDDEADLRETLRFALEKEGYSCDTYRDGEQAWDAFSRCLPDLAVLDVSMPRMDGLELCRRIRTISETVPVLFLSSKDEEIDRILGLEIGGDDYMCKPFSVRELTVRIKVLFRRLKAREKESSKAPYVIGHLQLDSEKYTATWKQSLLDLTVTEFLLLTTLARSPGFVRTREALMELVYPVGTYVSSRTIDTHIKRLRRKIQMKDEEFDEIETVYGLGYRYKQVGA
ncbi:response regulator transcription factor [Spirochaeta isovalerica]|uniref:DNA-binding response OmpR family regulator n=1 Tax=Spirochaeta isovalerica TaxID=150 RepID=A0A841RHL8_9SPIO|nr:response regulator transcription factor [Spirochaeta isovalerica]MBB6482269.1 DNA-binding response OmpR family regulator [Spirochaeta isovalerica]